MLKQLRPSPNNRKNGHAVMSRSLPGFGLCEKVVSLVAVVSSGSCLCCLSLGI